MVDGGCATEEEIARPNDDGSVECLEKCNADVNCAYFWSIVSVRCILYRSCNNVQDYTEPNRQGFLMKKKHYGKNGAKLVEKC